MDVQHLLTATRSARRTLDLDAPIDLGDIRASLEVAFHAANGTNNQSWRWIVVTDTETRRQLAERYREAYLTMTGGNMVGDLLADHGEIGRVMPSTEWLVENVGRVPGSDPQLASPWTRSWPSTAGTGRRTEVSAPVL